MKILAFSDLHHSRRRAETIVAASKEAEGWRFTERVYTADA